MKKNYYFRQVAIIVFVMLLAPQVQLFAQVEGIDVYIPGLSEDNKPKTDEERAIADAKRDVKAHFNPMMWIANGCLFSVGGLMLSERELKKVPTARLIGQSQTYVAFYVDAYQIEMKKQRYTYALGGCLLSGCLVGGVTTGILYNYFQGEK